MTEQSDEQLDRYLAGELTLHEEQELFRASLKDDDLSEMLATATLLKAGLAVEPYVPEIPSQKGWLLTFPRPQPARLAVAAGVIAAVAAVALVFVMVQRRGSVATGAPAIVSANPSERPTDAPPAAVAKPILLAARVGGPEFLGSDKRSPRSAYRNGVSDRTAPASRGLVTAVTDGEVAIDLGSVDGIEQGAVVQVFHGTEGSPVGTVTIARVFRESSSGFSGSAAISVGDRVELAGTTQAAGLGDQVSVRIAAGDVAGARAMAEEAVAFARSQQLPADALRRVLLQLGLLEYGGGALGPAEGHLREAATALDAAPSAARAQRAEILNALGVVLLDGGKLADADTVLQRARPHASGVERVRVTNNLAALAALRGERAEAEALYRAALAMAGGEDLRSERMAIAKNLEAVSVQR